MSEESDENIKPEVGGLRMPSTDDTDSVGEDVKESSIVGQSYPILDHQILMLQSLELPVQGHDYESAFQAINQAADRIIQALDATFTNRESTIPCTKKNHAYGYKYETQYHSFVGVDVKRDISIKKAIRFSDLYQQLQYFDQTKGVGILPYYDKVREIWIDVELDEYDYDSRVKPSIEVQKKIVGILYEVLDKKIFKKLNCCNNEVQKFKDNLEGDVTENIEEPQIGQSQIISTNQQTQPSTQAPQIFINQPSSAPTTPQKPTQQIVYTSKKAISKDKVGLGCLLEAIGICLFFLTIFTIIGPLVGLALFGCGYAIARQKRYVCRNCGNSLAPEAKICPTCSAVYTIGVFQILMKCVRFFMLIALFLFLYAVFTGKWDGIQQSALDWYEEKYGSDSASETIETDIDNPKVTTEPEVVVPEIEPTDLIAERDWTDLQGRKLKATLVDAFRRADGSYYGKFRKPDGTEFEYDVLKLSKTDRAMIKKVLVQEGRIIE